MPKLRAFSLLLILLSGSVLAQTAPGSKVYRWVDKDGRVHYSDQASASAQAINPKPIAATDDRVAGSGSGSAGLAKDDSRAQDCQRKKDQLVSYRAAGKVTETDGLGNTREYSPEEKQKLIDLTEKSVKDLCGEN